jgi:hypothetical protein
MRELYGKARLEEIRLVARLLLAAAAFLATAGLLTAQGSGALPGWWWLPALALGLAVAAMAWCVTRMGQALVGPLFHQGE